MASVMQPMTSENSKPSKMVQASYGGGKNMLSDADIRACADMVPDSLTADDWLYAFARAVEAMVRGRSTNDDWKLHRGDAA